MNYQKRLYTIMRLMETNKLDAIVVTQKEDIFYYVGWKASEGNILLINKSNKPALYVSTLEQDAEKLKTAKPVYLRKKEDLLKELKGFKSVGYDEYNLTANRFHMLHRLPIKLRKAGEIIKKPKEVKDLWEIEQIKKAVAVTKKVLDSQKIYGEAEAEVANKIEAGFRLAGAYPAFDTIISNGPNGIHHQPGKRIVNKMSPTIIDLGAKVNWYCCDVTRTFTLNRKWRKIRENIRNIQENIIDIVKPGIVTDDLKKLYEKLMEKYKYKIHHSFGHGIGLDVHEQITGKLKENMLITVEPGVYTKTGGCRIEDTILVRKGKANILSKSIRYD